MLVNIVEGFAEIDPAVLWEKYLMPVIGYLHHLQGS